MSLPAFLERELQRLARVPTLLVASDYDGTLAPIVEDPEQAWPLRESVVALGVLAELPQTFVGVISGRSLADLARLSGLARSPRVHLVGSHGSELDADFTESLGPEAIALRDRLAEQLRAISERYAGSRLETKPASLAFHVRTIADPDSAEQALKEVREGPGRQSGVYLKEGKKVVELGVLPTHKGSALQTIRRRVAASAVLFLGDDVTDEDAFAVLSGPDLGVKVGPGATRAGARLRNPMQVAQALAELCELRRDWLENQQADPIHHHSLLSDQRVFALLDGHSSISWMCLPRLDSPALFASLVGGPSAGCFSIRPADDGHLSPKQRYVEGTMTVVSEWPRLSVTDFLDCSHGRAQQRPGRTDLVRIVEGSGPVRIVFAPRLDFGRIPTRLEVHGHAVEIAESQDPVVLRAPGVRWTLAEEGPHHTAIGEADPQGETLSLILTYGSMGLHNHLDASMRRQETERYWRSWCSALRLPHSSSDLVRRSALLLKALVYGPTGAISAAATTSLPEDLGGVRNWDYRYCWPRDAALAALALVELGSSSEAMGFLDWLADVVDACESPERLRPLYHVSGANMGPEAEIGELAGYRGSRPVRVGNAAAGQVQLDVFGPIVDLVARLSALDAPLRPEHWRLVEGMVDAVVRRWREPDHGIWEIRKPRRHHVHTKTMCWLALERGLDIEERLYRSRRAEWERERDALAQQLLEHGYKPEIGAFTAAYDGDDLDAAALWVGLSGLVAPDDPRFVGTVAAVERELRRGPVVYRYLADDGLPGAEGGFLLCSSWLIDAFRLVGRIDDARALLSQLTSLAGPTGMLAEQFDPESGTALGNVPQAYSHLGLILSALRLDR